MQKDKEREIDDLLKKVVPKMNDELIEEWEKDVDYNYKFSKDFKKKMKKVVSEKKKESKSKSSIWGKIAAIILVTVVFSFGTNMVTKANPQLFYSKTEHYFDDAVEYHYERESDVHSFTPYDLVYIPEGYVEIDRNETDYQVAITYANEYGGEILWRQELVTDGSVKGLDIEYDDYELLEYAGEDIHVYKYDDGTKYVYYESGSTLFFIYATNLSTDDIYKMIEEMELRTK